MIINNKSVIGVYKYSDNSTYEKGDFVIYDNGIYICNMESSGVRPIDDSKKFSIYLGDKIATAEEYYNYVNSEDKSIYSDKYISMFTLNEILQNIYFGVNDSGVIDNYYNSPFDFSIKSIADVDESLDILDVIMTTPDLNNGMVRISRDVDSVKSIIVDLSEEIPGINIEGKNKSYYSSKSDDSASVILKQYTYDSSSKNSEDEDEAEDEVISRYRLQELIDPVFGETYYRYSKGELNGDNEWIFENTSNWCYNFSGEDRILSGRLNAILTHVSNLTTEYQNKLQELKGSFRYRMITQAASATSYSIPHVLVKELDLSSQSCLFTVVILKKEKDFSKSFSLTFDSLNGVSSIYNLFISDDCYLSVDNTDADSMRLSVSNTLYKIDTIYYQQSYV